MRLGVGSAGALVVASMVGIGVFTTAGYQVADLRNAPAVLLAWVVGGVAAMCGAATYAELTAALPRNGGEVAILGRAYHPALGFSAGVVSFFAGFAAPLAASAIAFEGYAAAALGAQPPRGVLAMGLIAVASVSQLAPRVGDRVQRWTTLGKVALVAGVGLVGLVAGRPGRLLVQERPFLEAVGDPVFAIGLVFVSYAYTGWNAAAYVAGDVAEPQRNLPRALLVGTGLVLVLYLGVQASLLSLAPLSQLAGKVEVADAAFRFGLGPTAATVLSAVIAFGLWSTASALVTTGAAVTSATSDERIPRPAANLMLCVVAALLVATSAFEALVTYVGVTLGVYAFLGVASVFVLRVREPDLARPVRTWGYPVTPLVFLVLSAWMIAFAVYQEPVVGAIGGCTLLGSIGLGLVFAPEVR